MRKLAVVLNPGCAEISLEYCVWLYGFAACHNTGTETLYILYWDSIHKSFQMPPQIKVSVGIGPVSVEARELVHLYLSICHGIILNISCEKEFYMVCWYLLRFLYFPSINVL